MTAENVLDDFQRAARAVLALYPEAKYAMLTVRLGDDLPLLQIPVIPGASSGPLPVVPLVAKSR
jgi:hypothetical protein